MKRYGQRWSEYYREWQEAELSDGEWVRYEEAQTLADMLNETIVELKKERDELKAALIKISGGGGVCTDNDDCPICIADKALGNQGGE